MYLVTPPPPPPPKPKEQEQEAEKEKKKTQLKTKTDVRTEKLRNQKHCEIAQYKSQLHVYSLYPVHIYKLATILLLFLCLQT